MLMQCLCILLRNKTLELEPGSTKYPVTINVSNNKISSNIKKCFCVWTNSAVPFFDCKLGKDLPHQVDIWRTSHNKISKPGFFQYYFGKVFIIFDYMICHAQSSVYVQVWMYIAIVFCLRIKWVGSQLWHCSPVFQFWYARQVFVLWN